jgi:RNA 2',3'-cyclic 3'-phosphodiesterase
VRCFLAVPLAEPGLAPAQRLLAGLRERIADIRWARPESLHVTVHFFGAIDEQRAADALHAVTPIAAHTAAFDIALDRLGSFPPRGIPRVLWVGPAHDIAPLNTLVGECRAALSHAGFDVEARPFHAHCTLGRPRSAWSDDARATWSAAAAAGVSEIRFSASRMVLYESRPAPGGAIYIERNSLGFATS